MTNVTESHSVRPVRIRTARDRVLFDLPRRGPFTDGVGSTGKLADDEFEVEDLWVEVDVADRWRAAFRLMESDDTFVVAEVRLFPRDEFPGRPHGEWRASKLGLLAGLLAGERKSGNKHASFAPLGSGITARLLREIPFAEHIRFAGHVPQRNRPEADELKDGPRRGRSDLFYARLAASYAARTDAGSRRPVADVARTVKMSTAQVRDAIHTARQRGLLTKAAAGRPGGALTPRGAALLAKQKPAQEERRERS